MRKSFWQYICLDCRKRFHLYYEYEGAKPVQPKHPPCKTCSGKNTEVLDYDKHQGILDSTPQYSHKFKWMCPFCLGINATQALVDVACAAKDCGEKIREVPQKNIVGEVDPTGSVTRSRAREKFKPENRARLKKAIVQQSVDFKPRHKPRPFRICQTCGNAVSNFLTACPSCYYEFENKGAS